MALVMKIFRAYQTTIYLYYRTTKSSGDIISNINDKNFFWTRKYPSYLGKFHYQYLACHYPGHVMTEKPFASPSHKLRVVVSSLEDV